jgi:putative transposase
MNNPYWNNKTANISSNVFIPSISNVNQLKHKSLDISWINANVYSNDLEHVLPLEKTRRRKRRKKKTPGDKLNSLKLNIIPTKEQKSIFSKWFGHCRKTYNAILSYIKEQPTVKGILTKEHLRPLFINNSSDFVNENSYLKDVPYDVRDSMLDSLLTSYKTNFKKGSLFTMHFRSKKKNQYFDVQSKHWNSKGAYNFLNKLRCEKQLPKKMHYAIKILKQDHKYYIQVPQKVHIIENQDNGTIVALDSGINNFWTCYDPTGTIIVLGADNIIDLARDICTKKALISKRAKAKGPQRRSYNLALKRICLRIKNKVTDFHNKVIKFLCTNYNTVLVPKLNFHELKNLSKKHKERLIYLRHCEFVDRLITKSKLYENCTIKVVKENYTSKTCCNCGHIKNNLGSNRIFNCSNCGIIMKRDDNGACGIYLKEKTEN